jgi:hypothetical protein
VQYGVAVGSRNYLFTYVSLLPDVQLTDFDLMIRNTLTFTAR